MPAKLWLNAGKLLCGSGLSAVMLLLTAAVNTLPHSPAGVEIPHRGLDDLIGHLEVEAVALGAKKRRRFFQNSKAGRGGQGKKA